MVRWTLPLGCLALVACKGDKTAPMDTAPEVLLPDVAERLEAGEVRAGIVESDAALIGGVSAEGRHGDFKIYNDRVQFIIQDARQGSFYEDAGGGIIDADVVRGEGVPGRDVIDEMMVMIGFGVVAVADQIEVLADGSDGEAAVLEVRGHGEALGLLNGAAENDEFIEAGDLEFVTELRLQPDSWLLEVTTTVTWNDEPRALQLGDFGMVAYDVAEALHAVEGLDGSGDSDGSWLGVVGQRNEVALALLTDDAPYPPSALQEVLSAVGPVLVGFRASESLETGDTTSWRRFVGVGPDLATLTGAWHAERGDPTIPVGGTVESDAGGVPGARVFLLDDDGGVETVALTDGDGRWEADVTASAPTALAVGRGPSIAYDLPPGAGWSSPYAAEGVTTAVLSSLADGSEEIPHAEGFGVSEATAATDDTALSLTAPGMLVVDLVDGLPFVVRVDFADGDTEVVDGRFVPGRPSGAAAWGYSGGEALDIPLEPGDYEVLVHRGLRWDYAWDTVTVASGEGTELSPSLTEAVRPPGWLAIDPHSHASPSGDGGISMEQRLLVHAGYGIQVHFGTDHDHIADYRPLLEPLGLDGVMTSVVATELSPVLRGHFNMYPLDIQPDRPNNGALPWWDLLASGDLTTAELLEMARSEMGGGEALVQSNHPDGSSGMFSLAGVDVDAGTVADPSRFDASIDTMEVLNDGQVDEFLELYLAMVNRGYDTVPIGVSDSHSHRGGVGENFTWLYTGSDDPRDLTDELLVESIRAGRTVVSRGPWISATVDGEPAAGATFEGSVEVELVVEAPDWMDVDELQVHRDGVLEEQIPVDTDSEVQRLVVTVSLEPDVDASYIFMAVGDTTMTPIAPGLTPWSMTAALRIDLDGDGWDAPLEPLSDAR